MSAVELPEVRAEFYTPQEYAAVTGWKLSTVWRRLRDGRLPHLARASGDRQYRIPRSAVTVTVVTEAAASTESAKVTDLNAFRERRATA